MDETTKPPGEGPAKYTYIGEDPNYFSQGFINCSRKCRLVGEDRCPVIRELDHEFFEVSGGTFYGSGPIEGPVRSHTRFYDMGKGILVETRVTSKDRDCTFEARVHGPGNTRGVLIVADKPVIDIASDAINRGINEMVDPPEERPTEEKSA